MPTHTQTPAPTTAPVFSYLTEEIPPCTPVAGSSVDPCEPRAEGSETTGTPGSLLVEPAFLVKDLFRSPTSPVFTTHIVLRGTYLPGTVRCTSGHARRAPAFLGRGQASYGLLIYCFADVRVNAYLLGTGPSTLTVIVQQSLYGGRASDNDEAYGLEQLESRRLAFERALSEGGRFQFDKPLRGYIGPSGPVATGPAGGIGGREVVLFIRPLYRISVEGWQVSRTWDVERREDDTVIALHPNREWWGTGSMQLPALTQEVTEAHQAHVTLTGGRIGEGDHLPMLVTDANRLRQYFSDPKVGGYAPGVPAPTQPPAAYTCAAGSAVTSPSTSWALVHDCEALLGGKDSLRGTATLDWSKDAAITSWEGVTTSGTPNRVTKLLLPSKNLSGSIPGELGDLAGMTHLNLSSNSLTGEIPRELGRLSNLTEIKLSGNSLTGCIPAALKDVTTNDLSSLNLLYCPPAPDSLAAGTLGETSVSLSWTAVPNASKYRVEYLPPFSGGWTLHDDALTGASHTVDGLLCEREYHFRVSAYGDDVNHATAWSDPSAIVNATTGECVSPVFGEDPYEFSTSRRTLPSRQR